MGKVVVLISPTLDGFADGKNVIIDPDFFAFTESLLSEATLVAFGKKTFEDFSERWQARLEDDTSAPWLRKMAHRLHEIPKIVFSGSLTKAAWYNSIIVKTLDAQYIGTLKKNGENLLTFGSVSIVESLIEMNVVDDYYFNIQPVIAGGGDVRFFTGMRLTAMRRLKYIGCTALPSGALVIHYKPAKMNN